MFQARVQSWWLRSPFVSTALVSLAVGALTAALAGMWFYGWASKAAKSAESPSLGPPDWLVVKLLGSWYRPRRQVTGRR